MDPARLFEALLATGRRVERPLRPLADAADPKGRVRPASRLLCAALGSLSGACCRALGGSDGGGAERAGAMLALLTKIDDEVIDGRGFHGGRAPPRAEVREKVRIYLDPTLCSLRDAAPADAHPRCHLAAQTGRALRALAADDTRLERLLAVIAHGWDVQAEAVSVLSAHPGEVEEEDLARVTASISGAWLLMVTMVGALPAARALTVEEEAAFYRWGAWIQRADALADLEREIGDGFVSTVPGWALGRRAGERYLRAADEGDFGWIYAQVGAGLDRECLPPPGALEEAAASLADLGEVPHILRWIHSFLLWRYLSHPRFRGQEAAFSPFVDTARWRTLPGLEEVACSAP